MLELEFPIRSTTCWHDPRDLDAETLWQAKVGGRSLAGLEVRGATRLAPEAVLTTPADIVIPAVMANQITAAVAAAMLCQIIREIVNGPIASDAEAVVAAKGILVIPDVVANAGGITMSHFEWAQNRSGLSWTAADARTRLDARMVATARAMIHAAQEHNVSLAVAAQLLAVQHISARFS